MTALLYVAILTALMAVGGDAATDQPAGSHLPPDKNSCAMCHGEESLWEGDNRRLFVSSEHLADDVHWTNGVNCSDCHGGNPGSFNVLEAHASEPDPSQTDIRPFESALVEPTRTPARLEAQTRVCGRCHQQAETDYRASVHGQGVEKAGLVVAPACVDCHGSHGIYPIADERSSLFEDHVADTCGKCHEFIEERLQKSVHGRHAPLTGQRGTVARGGETTRKPTCIDCHQGHDLPDPRKANFRLALPSRCTGCHTEMFTSYEKSVHGRLTVLGYVPAAKCSDCHGAHDILPRSDPNSRLLAANRHRTCGKCHADMPRNFLDWDPHADPTNEARSPILYWVNLGLTILLCAVFGVFGVHSLMWFFRSLFHVAKEGRPPYPGPGTPAYTRFKPVHRAAHAVLMTSFLGLALTGLPLKYSDYQWGQTLSMMLGGFTSTGLWHRIFGIANIGCLLFYCLWFGSQTIMRLRKGIPRGHLMFGPDSPVPNWRDLQDVGRMLRWFVGLGPKPTFERWTYWEKFDLWAASCDIVLIGTTGLILWLPNQFCEYLPGGALNVATLVHGKLALLATGFVFAIHFLSADLRPDKFPMDMTILTGKMSREEMLHERREYYERLRREGRLEQMESTMPPRGPFILLALAGAIGLLTGLALLVGIVLGLFT